MKIKESIETLENNILMRLRLFAETIDKLDLVSSRYKLIATGEVLLFLLHHVDRLAYEKDLSQKVRTTIRDEIVGNLINKDFLPPRITLKLLEDGIEPSLNAFGVLRSVAAESLLPVFLEEVAKADLDYSSCNEFIAANPLDEKGLVNKLSARIRRHCDPEGNIFSQFFMVTAVSDIMIMPELVTRDRKALSKCK